MNYGCRLKTKFQLLFYVYLAWQLTACASLSQYKLFKNSALTNENPAPAKLAPQNHENQVDPFYVRSQADYHFSLAEALSNEDHPEKAIEEYKQTLLYDPDSILVRIKLAAEYLKQGLLTEAVEQAEQAVQLDPKSVKARMLLGSLYSTMKIFDLAKIQYEVVLSEDPQNEEAALIMGAILAEEKKYDQATKHFEDLASRHKDSRHKYYYFMARIYTERGASFYSQAEKYFVKSISAKPEYIEAVLGLAKLYLIEKKDLKATQILESYQDKFGPNEKMAELLSRYYLEREDFPKALKQLEVLSEYDNQNINIKVKVALILIELKKYDQAIERLEEILVYAPYSEKILFYLGAVQEEVKNNKEAIKNYKQIGPTSKYYPEAVLHTAYLLKNEGQVEASENIIVEAIKVRGDIPQFYAFYASLLDESQKYTQAEKLLEEAVEKFPEHTQLRFFLGSIYDRMDKVSKTIEQMKKVIELDPSHTQALNYLAYTYADQGIHLDQAEELAMQALKQSPEDSFVLDTFGWILFKKGKVEDSIRYLEKAHENKKDESIIAEHLGDAYYKFQLSQKAKKMYIKAIEHETDLEKVSKIKAKINALDRQLEAHNNSKNKNRSPASEAKK